MLEFKASEWTREKEFEWAPCTNRVQYHIEVNGETNVELAGKVSQDGEWVTLRSGAHMNFKPKFEGFSFLRLKSPKAFSMRLRHIARQNGEPINHENPPAPPMPGANNLVAQFQRMLKDHAKARRGNMLEPDGLPSLYEMDEDDGLWEEDMHEMQDNSESSPPSSSDPQQNTASAPSPKQEHGDNPSDVNAGGMGDK